MIIEVKDYQLYASNGAPIRKATMVSFPDGECIRFTERLSRKKAIEQAVDISTRKAKLCGK